MGIFENRNKHIILCLLAFFASMVLSRSKDFSLLEKTNVQLYYYKETNDFYCKLTVENLRFPIIF